jgi:electron transport complex protein RnfA
MKKKLAVLYNLLGLYLPLITVNCAIFGVALINIRDYNNLLAVVINSLGAGGGFLLAIVILASIREKLEFNPDIPQIFKGFPLALFSAGLMSIAFMGFQGLF